MRSTSAAPSEGVGTLLHAAVQRCLPHHVLSALMYAATRCTLPAWKNGQIRWFVRHYGVDMSIAAEPNPFAYRHFNAFFTRALVPGVRPIAPCDGVVTCPADGTLSEFGHLDGDTLLQAKGMHYCASALLGGDVTAAEVFAGGCYLTVYLSPRDYHRVHMPLAGRLARMVHVPGRLFSVNPASAASISGLFARNERVVSVFDTRAGPLAVVLVGAIFVGCVEQVWCGVVTPPRGRRVRRTDYPAAGHADAIHLAKGEEMGRFNMGSTVVMLLPRRAVRWAATLRTGQTLRMGQALGTLAGR